MSNEGTEQRPEALAEKAPHSQLLDELREQRVEEVYDGLESSASRYLKSAAIRRVRALVGGMPGEEPKQDVYGGRTFAILGNLASPSTAQLFSDLAEFAHYDGSITADVLTQPDGSEVAYPLTNDLVIRVEKVAGTHVSYNLESNNDYTDKNRTRVDDDIDNLFAFLGERDSQDEVYAARMQEQLSAGENEVYSDETFSFQAQPNAILQFIIENANRLTPESDILLAKEFGYHAVIENIYNSLPAHYVGDQVELTDPSEGIYFTEEGNIDRVVLTTRIEGLELILKNADATDSRDLSELDLKLGVRLDVKRAYAREQDYNGRYREGAVAFLETPTAAQLLSSFEQVGLVPNKIMKDCVNERENSSAFSGRYGNGYAHLTREVAKCVNDSKRSVTELFDGDEDTIRAAITALGDVDDPAAQALVSLIKDVVERRVINGDTPVLQVSEGRTSLRDGSCKDAEVYAHDSSKVVVDSDGEPLFIRSSFKRPLVVTLRETLLNGVKLPAGSLLAVEGDGYIFMRLTAFSFDAQEAAAAFGAQDAENRAYSKQYAAHAERIRGLMNRTN